MRKVVVNTTPLIALSHVGQLSVLQEMYGEIIIPEAVYRELSVKSESTCKRAVDSSLDWIRVENIQNQMAKAMYKTQPHDGEVEVMILAKEVGADVVIIDDANAKKHAKYLDLPVTGTLGVLIKAKQAEELGQPKLRYLTPHQIRHTYTTLAYEAGIDEKEVSARLGHASELVTKDTYTHLRGQKKEEQDAAVNKICIS